MSRRGWGSIVAGAAVAAWAGLSGQQEMLPRPGPGTGVMNVNVINHPAVAAAQSGEWRVAIENVPSVRVGNTVATTVAAPRFLQPGRTYVITWSTGESERASVREVGDDGWVLTSGGRWLNLRSARAVEER